MDDKIEEARQKYEEELSRRYAPEVRDSLNSLKKDLSGYSDWKTFRMLFDAATAKFKRDKDIKRTPAGVHRYDLYATLIFAMKFYGRRAGHVRFMCIDEGQDLALNEYRLIYELNNCDLVFNIFGDTNQLIKASRGIDNCDTLKTIFRAQEYTLNENYRNTNQITRFCNDSFGMNVLQTGVDGAKVREVRKREMEAEIAALDVGDSRIAVLLPRAVDKNDYLYDISFTSGNAADRIVSGKVAVMYVDEVKGIEFDKVYVVHNNMGRNERYIAYTRALSELIIVNDETA